MNASRTAAAALFLCIFVSALGTSIANVTLPTLTRVFDAPVHHVQWVVVVYLLAITTMIVSVGRLADLYGRRRLLLAGIAVFSTGSAACGIAPTLPILIVARAVQGLGAAAMMALAMAFAAELVAKEKSGRAMGLLGTTSAFGTAVGPSLGGYLTAGFGWQAVFLVLVPVALAAALAAWQSLPADPKGRRPREGFDLAGGIVLAVTLAAYAVAMTRRHEILLLAALAALAIFLRIETRAAAPLLTLDIFADRTRSAAFVTNALVTTVVMASLVVGPFYLAGALGLDAVRTGLVLSVGPVAAALAGLPAGAAVDRFGTHRMAVTGLFLMAAGCGALSLLPAGLGVPGWVAPLVVITAGYALFQAANNTAVMTGGPAAHRGVISGMLNLSRNVGLITGASLMLTIYASSHGAASGMSRTFAVAAGLVVIALVISYAAAGRQELPWNAILAPKRAS